MSPEQIEAREVDGRSDQFSLAVLAYEILTGAKPFQGDSIPAIAHLIVYGARPLPHSVDPTASRDNWSMPGFSARSRAFLMNDSPPARNSRSALQVAFAKPLAMAPVPERPVKQPSRSINVFAITAILFVAVGAGFFFYTRYKAQPAPLPSIETGPAAGSEKTPPDPSVLPSKPPPLTPPPVAVTPTLPPVIKQFRADPGSVKTGSPATLIWEVNGARTESPSITA